MLRRIFLIILTKYSLSEEVFYNINNNNVLHKVSEKFLSISIDPAVLLAGVNLSDASLLLARHLSPAYIRLVGPSTPFVKYIDDEDDLISPKSEEGTTVVITPSMWFGINEWLNLANLTPVFGINDNETDKGVWDPKSTLPLLEMSDKFGVTCYWQLGYDCSNKTAMRYVEDLNILRQTLNGFPEHNDTWKIVGSDLSRCIFDELDKPNFESYVNDLDENVNAVMWESSLVPKMEVGLSKSAMWTSVPKDPKPVTFSSAMEWAKHIGETAKMEYDVIFRQPRLLEITHDTPVFWFSFLHKKLMGTSVLEVSHITPNPDLCTFAHCTKRQNNFVRSGAITVMMINSGPETNTANIRLGNIMLDKSMEVQSYFLTTPDESSTEVYLNGQKLTMDMLKKADDILKPKLRRAKIRGYISLEIPSQTIGFFVLTGAKNTLCGSNEEDLDSILQEINGDQDLSLSEEAQFKIEERWRNVKTDDKSNTIGEKMTLETIKKNILQEMELDKSYYNKMLKKQESNGAYSAQEDLGDKEDIDRKKETLHKHLRAFIEKGKIYDVSKNSGAKRQNEKQTLPANNLHFTIKEVEDILKKRAKAKAAAKNIKLTSSELDMLVDKATIRLPKHFISKRDINAILLEEKANFHKNNMFSQEAYERFAKDHKLFPKTKFRRSELSDSRIRRNINKTLLNLKAKLEEHKKYMLARASRLRNSHNQKQNSVSKRDINLDLLKKRTKPASSYSKNIAMQPHLKARKNHFHEQEEKHATKMISGDISDELFSDFLDSDESTIEDTKLFSNLFAEMPNSGMDISDYEGYFTEPKVKRKKISYDLFPKPKWNVALRRKSLSKKKNKSAKTDYDEYLQLLTSSNEFENFDEELQPCNHDWGFSFESPKEMKGNRFTELWHLKSPKTGRNKNKKSAVMDLDDLTFSEDFEYGLHRKKRGTLRNTRETNSIVKEKLKSLINNIKSDVKKVRKQITNVKVKNVGEKIKSKMELRRQKQNEKLKEKEIKTSKKNVQTVSKSKGKNENYHDKNKNSTNIILSANSKENTKSSLLDNKVKRSLMNNNLNSLFGQYQPLTTGLRPWKPIDILGLQNNYLSTLPFYTWLQNQNLRNTLLQNGYFGLRKRRYIKNGIINSIENEILNSEEQKENDKEFVKYSTTQNILKENKLVKNNYIPTTNKLDVKNLTTTAIKEKTTQKYVDPVVEIVSGEKMTYLERILGKKKVIPLENLIEKVKPLENFIEKVREDFNNINKNLRDFLSHLF